MKTWYHADFETMKIEPVKILKFNKTSVWLVRGRLSHQTCRSSPVDAYCPTWSVAKIEIVNYWRGKACVAKAQCDEAVDGMVKAIKMERGR